MKILVTGGAGMIGSNLCSKLLNEGHDVTVIDNLWRGDLNNLKMTCGQKYGNLNIVIADLTQLSDWISWFDKVDCVYHLADIVAGIGYVFKNEGFIFRKNLQINANVAIACELMKVKRYVYVGTACSFPADLQNSVDSLPLVESQQFPANPESAYGWSKLMGELDAGYLANSLKIPSVILVLHNVYGTPCDYKTDRAQVIPALTYRALTTGLEEGFIDVWGNGKQGRAFIHVNDIVDGLYKALYKGDNEGAIQLGPNICTTITDVASTIIDLLPKKIYIKYDLTKPTGDIGRSADFTKAKNILGWEPKTDLKEGLQRLIEWISLKEDITF